MLSFSIILNDLTKLYTGSGKPAADPDWDFGVYQERRRLQKQDDIEAVKAYWTQRLPELPDRPALPLKQPPEQLGQATYRRLSYVVPDAVWQGLSANARANNTTIAMALLAAYTAVIERYSENERFLINIPVFDRDIDEGVDAVVSDFTNLLLLETGVRQDADFLTLVRHTEAQFRADIAHTSYSGIQVQRDLAKLRSNTRFMAPLVYSYMIGTELMTHECKESFGSLHYMITQTPQVWIDFQIVECDGSILLSWDTAKEVFPDGLTDSMFQALTELIEQLAAAPDWHFIPDAVSAAERERFAENRSPAPPAPAQALTDAMLQYADSAPDKTALLDTVTGDTVSFGELRQKMQQLAAVLRDHGVQQGDHVGFTFARGAAQVMAAAAIAAYGACYVPIGENLPYERRERVHTQMDVRYLLTTE